MEWAGQIPEDGAYSVESAINIYTENAWVLARPSGTEPIAKLYAETFRDPDHLRQILIEGGELFGLETRSLV